MHVLSFVNQNSNEAHQRGGDKHKLNDQMHLNSIRLAFKLLRLAVEVYYF